MHCAAKGCVNTASKLKQHSSKGWFQHHQSDSGTELYLPIRLYYLPWNLPFWFSERKLALSSHVCVLRCCLLY
jgi:hypothetical protein